MARCKTDFLCNLKQVGTQLALILYLPLIFTFCGGGGAGSFGEQEVGGQGYVRKERNGPELGVLKGWEVGELGKIMQQCLIFCNPNRAKRWVRAGNARYRRPEVLDFPALPQSANWDNANALGKMQCKKC